MELFHVLLGLGIVAALGTILWAIFWDKKKKDIDVDAGDVTLLALGMEDPMLGVAAFTAADAGSDDGGADIDIDITPADEAIATEANISTGPAEEVWSHVETPAPAPEPGSAAKEVFTHVEIPAVAPVHETHVEYTPHPEPSYSSHSYSDYSSSDSGSSGSSSDSGGGGCGGGGD